jgi:CRP-like cAMP-binding protein
MAENSVTGSDRPLLDDFKDLGSATAYAEQIFALVGHSQFFAEFNRNDINLLADYMRVYRAQPGKTIIREGDVGDYMLLIIGGEVDIYKKNQGTQEQQHMTSVTPGMTLGEMSMIDGEPRFASCVALRETVFTVLTRDNMVKIILENPSLGAKILIKLVSMLALRLRQTSTKLLQYMP